MTKVDVTWFEGYSNVDLVSESARRIKERIRDELPRVLYDDGVTAFMWP